MACFNVQVLLKECANRSFSSYVAEVFNLYYLHASMYVNVDFAISIRLLISKTGLK